MYGGKQLVKATTILYVQVLCLSMSLHQLRHLSSKALIAHTTKQARSLTLELSQSAQHQLTMLIQTVSPENHLGFPHKTNTSKPGVALMPITPNQEAPGNNSLGSSKPHHSPFLRLAILNLIAEGAPLCSLPITKLLLDVWPLTQTPNQPHGNLSTVL